MIRIGIYNLKGGVGKTTSAVNLAYLFAHSGYRTILWDWDPQSAASWFLGVDHTDYKSIKIFNRGLPIGSMRKASPFPNLTVIPSDLSLRKSDLATKELAAPHKFLQKMISALSENSAVLIFDCPPTLSPTMEYIMSNVDLLLLPTLPSPLSVRALDQVQAFFKDYKRAPKKLLGFFTHVDRRRQLHQLMLEKPPTTVKMLNNWIPYSSDIEKMGIQRAPLPAYDSKSPATIAYIRLFKEIGQHLPYKI